MNIVFVKKVLACNSVKNCMFHYILKVCSYNLFEIRWIESVYNLSSVLHLPVISFYLFAQNLGSQSMERMSCLSISLHSNMVNNKTMKGRRILLILKVTKCALNHWFSLLNGTCWVQIVNMWSEFELLFMLLCKSNCLGFYCTFMLGCCVVMPSNLPWFAHLPATLMNSISSALFLCETSSVMWSLTFVRIWTLWKFFPLNVNSHRNYCSGHRAYQRFQPC